MRPTSTKNPVSIRTQPQIRLRARKQARRRPLWLAAAMALTLLTSLSVESKAVCYSGPTVGPTIDVLGAPFDGIAATPDGSRVYVTVRVPDPLRFQVIAIDTATDTVIDKIEIGEEGASSSSARTILIPEAGRFAYAVTPLDNVIKINLTTHAVSTPLHYTTNPSSQFSSRGAVVTADGKYLFLTNFTESEVTVVETSSMTVVARIPVESVINGVVLSPLGTEVYALTTNDGNTSPLTEPVIVTVIDVGSLRAIRSIPIGAGNLANSIVSGRVTPDARTLYVQAASMTELVEVDLVTYRQARSRGIPTGGEGIHVTPAGDELWNFHNGYGTDPTANVFETASLSILDNIDTTGQTARWLHAYTVFDPEGHVAVIPLFLTGEIQFVDVATHTILDQVLVGGSPTSLVFLPDGTKAYVTARTSATTGNVVVLNMSQARPRIEAVDDIGNDQGRRVRLTWQASEFDAAGADPGCQVVEYGIWRRQEAGLKSATQSASLRKVFPPGSWDFVATIPARGEASYSALVETLCDETPTQSCPSTFFVSAMTADPFTYFDSSPASGSSIDNLSPLPPQAVAAAYAAQGNQLSWVENAEEDLRGYRVYRGFDPDFTPGPESLIAETGGTSWLDDDGATWNAHYKITAIDFNENESEASSPATTTGVEDGPAAALGAVAQLFPAHPNPFNPVTQIPFELAKAAHVRLTIHDAAGRLVTTLVDRPMEAGRQEIRWTGLDQRGQRVASGTYLYALRADGEAMQARRMVMLK